LISLTRTAALEWGSAGIRVNAVAPGTIRTPKTIATAAGQSTSEDVERAAIPLGHRGGPADIAGAVAFLLSDLARWITGQVLAVDGGSSALPSFLDADRLPVFVTNAELRERLTGKARP
jgi:NAD(P)-dependent dehydrogenase (short-subunit alcohol dehydrogenase family)